jgi:hypothetical protein
MTPPTRLWALLPAALTCAALYLVPLRDPIAWWHLVWGRAIDAFGAVPAANHVRYTLDAAQPALHAPWLADLTLWRTFDLGGVPLLLTLRALCLALALALATLAARERASGALAAFLGALGLAIALPAAEPTPAALVAPLVAALCVLANAQSAWWALGAPLLAALWANLDASSLLAPLLIAGAALGQEDARMRRAWGAAALASAGALMLNPRGAALYGHALDVWRTWPASGLSGAGWQPAWMGQVWVVALVAVPAIWIGAALWVAWRAGERRALGALAWLVVLSAQALVATRGLVWLGAALPWVAACAMPAALVAKLERPLLVWWARWPLALVALLFVAAAQPTWVVHPDVALAASPYKLRAAQPYQAVVLDETPVEGAALLKPYPVKPRLWVEPRWAGFVLWTLEPVPPAPLEPLVQVDPRAELGDPAHRVLERLVMTSDVWRGAFQQYRVRAALLDAHGQDGYLVEALRGHPDWITAHQTEDYVLFLRR